MRVSIFIALWALITAVPLYADDRDPTDASVSIDDPVPVEPTFFEKSKAYLDRNKYRLGVTGIGALGTAYYALDFWGNWKFDGPYLHNGKLHENNCHSGAKYLTHTREDIRSDDENRQNAQHRLVPRNKLTYVYPGLLGVGAWMWVTPNDEETEEELWAEFANSFRQPTFVPKSLTEAEVRNNIQKSKKLKQLLSDFYGDERGERILNDILQSPEWNEAIRELLKATTWKQFQTTFRKHKPALDAHLKQFANKREKKGRSEVVVDSLGIQEAMSGRAWHQQLTKDDPDRAEARSILPPEFYEDKVDLPWENFPHLAALFKSAQREIFKAVVDTNRTLPPLHMEAAVKDAKFAETDRALIKKQPINEVSGVAEVRAFMPKSTQDFLDDIFGHDHSDLADQLTVEIAAVWKYPDLMIKYRRSESNDRVLRMMKEELQFMRAAFGTKGDLDVPVQREDIERACQWTAAQLVLFRMLEEELPVANDTVPKVLEKLREAFAKKGKNEKK